MENFSVKNKTDNPVSKVVRRPGIPSPFVTFGKAADSLRWFSRPKPLLVQNRLAVNLYLNVKLSGLHVKRKIGIKKVKSEKLKVKSEGRRQIGKIGSER